MTLSEYSEELYPQDCLLHKHKYIRQLPKYLLDCFVYLDLSVNQERLEKIYDKALDFTQLNISFNVFNLNYN